MGRGGGVMNKISKIRASRNNHNGRKKISIVFVTSLCIYGVVSFFVISKTMKKSENLLTNKTF